MCVIKEFFEQDMTTKEIIKLAEKDGLKTKLELESKMVELKSENWGILNCILYVSINQSCDLHEATEIVVNTSAWVEKKDEFLKHQVEMSNKFIEYSKEDIEKIEETHYPDRTERKVFLKSKSKPFKNWFKKKRD